MTRQPTAAALLREGLGYLADVAGVLLFGLLLWQVIFGGSQRFEREAMQVGLIGAAACWLRPGAARSLPASMLIYIGIALLSSAVHQWPTVASATEPRWWSLFAPASHLLVMAPFVLGAAHLLRTPVRLAAFTAMLATAILVVSTQTLFDRISSNFVYVEGGSVSLPSVAQWGGMHQIGLLLVIVFPLVIALALFSTSIWRIVAGIVLGGGLLVIAVLNGSRSGMVAMVVSAVAMGAASFLAARSVRWRPGYYVLAVAGLAVAVWLGLAQVATARAPLTSVTSGRLPIWGAAARVVTDHPWLGVGPGNYRVAMIDGGYAERYLPRYAARFRDVPDPAANLGTEQAHNLLLHTAAEIGVIGAISLLAFWLWMIAGCWRSLRASHLPMLSGGLMITLMAFLLRSMYDNFVDVLGTADRTRVLAWMLFGAALALRRTAPLVPAGDDGRA